MKALKRTLLIALFAAMSVIGYSQSGWTSGRYYAYQGQTTTQTQYKNVYNQWCNCWQTVRYCRQTNWYKEYRAGYVYYWGQNGWYSKWEEGYFWYYTWSAWYQC